MLPYLNSSIGYLLALLGEDDARMNGRPRDLFLESTCSQPPDHDLEFSVLSSPARGRLPAGLLFRFPPLACYLGAPLGTGLPAVRKTVWAVKATAARFDS